MIVEEMTKRGYLADFELMVLLALMRLGEDAYGVPISREIERQSRREVALGTVYAALERLEEAGLVASELGEATAQRGGRVRDARRALINLWRGLKELEGGRA
jgi:PadR family transcriptional regulator PadR